MCKRLMIMSRRKDWLLLLIIIMVIIKESSRQFAEGEGYKSIIVIEDYSVESDLLFELQMGAWRNP